MSTTDFRKRLLSLLNEESMENRSNTPDFILCNYLVSCLEAFDLAVVSRDAWGRPWSKSGDNE